MGLNDWLACSCMDLNEPFPYRYLVTLLYTKERQCTLAERKCSQPSSYIYWRTLYSNIKNKKTSINNHGIALGCTLVWRHRLSPPQILITVPDCVRSVTLLLQAHPHPNNQHHKMKASSCGYGMTVPQNFKKLCGNLDSDNRWKGTIWPGQQPP